MATRESRRRKTTKRVRRKIEQLIEEGKPPRQAVAIAHAMEEEGRLGPRGGYRRKKGRKRRGN